MPAAAVIPAPKAGPIDPFEVESFEQEVSEKRLSEDGNLAQSKRAKAR